MCPSLLRDCLPPEDWNVAPSLSYAIFIPANAGPALLVPAVFSVLMLVHIFCFSQLLQLESAH